MPATALLRFVQGATVGQNGRALKGVLGVAVEVRNSVNTDVASWQIDLVYADPGSSVVPATPFAFGNSSGTPLAIFTPDRAGSYRWVLKVWGVPNRVGTPADVDIRNFVVPEENGLYVPPVQIWPRPLPPPASGEPGAKPNELNFNGLDEGWGWAGDGDDDGGLNELIRRVDALIQINLPEPGVDDGKQAVASNGNLVYVSSSGVPLSMVRVVDEGTTTLLADQNGSAGSPYASVQDAIDDVPTGGVVVIVKATAAEPLTIAKDIAITAWRADVWGAFGGFENGGEDVVVGDITVTGSREVAISGVETGAITCSAGTSTILPSNGAEIGQITGGPILKAAATSFKSAGNVISGPSEIRDSIFQVNGTLITTSGTTLELQACRFIAGGNTIVFSGAPGTLFVDPIAYQFWSDVTETLTNGALVVYGRIVPIIDSTLVDVGGTLGRATISGDFNVAAGSNTSTFRSFAENSFLMKGTGAGVPTDVAVGSDRLLGRSESAALGPVDGTQVTAMLDVFTPLLKGLSPASGGGTTNYQRADGNWTNPADLPNNVALRGETTTPSTFENLIKLDTNNAVVLGDGWVTGFATAAGTLPTVGILRFPHNTTIIAAATAAGANDSVLTYGVIGTNFVHLNGVGGLRLQGSGGVAQLGDNSFQFLSLTTPFVLSTNDRSDANSAPLTVRAGGATSGNIAGRALKLQGGRRAGTGDMGPVSIELNQDSSTTYPMVEAAHLANLRRVLALVRGAAITTTQMSTGTGDLVVYVGNCATPPSANPVDGVIVYTEAGVLKCRDPSGAITIIGPVAFTGEVTKSAGSTALNITAGAVTLAKHADLSEGTTIGREPGTGTGTPVARPDQSIVDGGLHLFRLGPALVPNTGGTAVTIGTIPLANLFYDGGGRYFVECMVYANATAADYAQAQKVSFNVLNNEPGSTLGDRTVVLEERNTAYASDLIALTVDIVNDEVRLRGTHKTASLSLDDGHAATVYAVAKVTRVQPDGYTALAVQAMMSIFGSDSEALWLADFDYVTLDGSNVASFLDATGNGNTLVNAGSNKPIWEAAGWSGNGSVQFSVTGTPDELAITAGGTVRTCINGSDDVPVSVLMLIEPIGFGTVPIIGWYNAGTPELYMEPRSATDTRWNGVSGATTGASNIAISAAQHAHAVSIPGDILGVSAWVDTTEELNGASWNITGGNASDSFRVTGNASFRLRALMVVSRAVTYGEVAAWRELAEAISTTWVPSKLGEALHLWLDSSQASPSSGTLTSWTDDSLSGNDAVIGTAPTVEATGWNGTYPSVLINGATSGHNLRFDSLPAAFSGDDAPYTITWVGQVTADPAALGVILCAGSSSTDFTLIRLQVSATDQWEVFTRDDANSASRTITGGTFDTNRHQHTIRFNGTTLQYWIDGVSIGTSSTALGACNFSRFTLGGMRRSSGVLETPIDARHVGVTVLNRALTDNELAQLWAHNRVQFGGLP